MPACWVNTYSTLCCQKGPHSATELKSSKKDHKFCLDFFYNASIVFLKRVLKITISFLANISQPTLQSFNKMAVHIKDNLSKIIETDIISDRINSFVWISIAAKESYFTNLNPTPASHRTLMADHLKNDENTAQNIRNAIKNCFIPDQNLKWITNSRRQALWVEQYIALAIMQARPSISNHISTGSKSSLSEIWGFSIPFHLLGKNRSIALFDYWTSTNFSHVQHGINLSKLMQLDWQKFIKADKFFAWLDNDDSEKKRASFWAWLEFRDKTFTQSQPEFQSHEELLIFFDNPRFSESDKEVLSQNYRKIWNQQKNREESNEKKTM